METPSTVLITGKPKPLIEIQMPSETEKKELLPLLESELKRARSICRINCGRDPKATNKCEVIKMMLSLIHDKSNPDKWARVDLELLETFATVMFGFTMRLTLDPESDVPPGARAAKQAMGTGTGSRYKKFVAPGDTVVEKGVQWKALMLLTMELAAIR